MCGRARIKLLSALLHRQEREAPGVAGTGSFGASTVRLQFTTGAPDKEYRGRGFYSGDTLIPLRPLLVGRGGAGIDSGTQMSKRKVTFLRFPFSISRQFWSLGS